MEKYNGVYWIPGFLLFRAVSNVELFLTRILASTKSEKFGKFSE